MRPVMLLLVAAVALVPDRARAQTAYSFDFGAITAFEDAAVQVGFRAAPAVANKAGADILLSTFPEALVHGFLLFILDVDATYGAPLGDKFTLYPRFGGSIIAGGGNGGAGGAYGLNVGVGVLGRATPTFGARVDYTHHRFMGGGGGETLPISSISVGFVWMH
jgi:hypothetical protein